MSPPSRASSQPTKNAHITPTPRHTDQRALRIVVPWLRRLKPDHPLQKHEQVRARLYNDHPRLTRHRQRQQQPRKSDNFPPERWRGHDDLRCWVWRHEGKIRGIPRAQGREHNPDSFLLIISHWTSLGGRARIEGQAVLTRRRRRRRLGLLRKVWVRT